MQIVIPMAGIGQKFVNAGYKDPKPLLLFDDRPIISRIIELFPGEKNFIFVCNKDHLKKTKLATVLKRAAPGCKIIGIDRHKLGPVYTVSRIFDQIDPSDEVIVHYCDVAKYWDYEDFLKHTRSRKADGALSAHIGFHPHMLRGTNYALIKAKNQWFEELVEKKPLEDLDSEYVSDGLYYFRRGDILEKYFKATMEEKLFTHGEFYASVVYNLMKRDGLKVSIFESQHLMSAQNPVDFEDYQAWSECFRQMVGQKKKLKLPKDSIVLMPAAGRGKRFADKGYKDPKPLIEVSGKPMIVQAASYLPSPDNRIFVCLNKHLKEYPLEKEIKKRLPNAKIISLAGVTEGQACTCEVGIKSARPEQSLHIIACDSLLLYDEKKFEKLIADEKVDAVAWGATHIPMSIARPEMYGWIKKDGNNNIKGISVKKPISNNPFEDYIITGTFYFRKVEIFRKVLASLYKKNKRVNNEFYVDSMIDEAAKLGYRVKLFPVEHFISWGTPEELKTFEYWQSFFHKAKWHPYLLEKDKAVEKSKVGKISKKYTHFKQKFR